VQRILIGGGRGMMAMPICRCENRRAHPCHPDMQAAHARGQWHRGTAVQAALDSASSRSVVDQLADRYGQIYREWLLPRA